VVRKRAFFFFSIITFIVHLIIFLKLDLHCFIPTTDKEGII